MLTDALLAWVHYVLIFALTGCLVTELFVYRRTLQRDVLEVLARVDLAYGIFAGLIIASGVFRVIYSPKGSAYYLHNPIFWTKMSIFLLLAIFSIPPTLHYLRLRRNAGATIEVAPAAFARTRGLLVAECGLLVALPLCAALMARGFGWPG